MSIDDDVREAVDRPRVPRPRTSDEDTTVARLPWPEPWGSSRAARPRTEYWDAATASWRSRGPVVAPRTAD
jgi:hypothetical protein